MSEREKLLEQVCARVPVEVVDEIDAYIRAREREARVPLSRSLGVGEILVKWAHERRGHA